MPELPEVETIKNALSLAVSGAVISKAEVLCDRFREQIPSDFADKINGATILQFRRIGKYMIVDLNNRLSLIWHLGMSGRVKICQNESYVLQKHDHVVLTTDKGIIVFNDARRFGMLTYCPTDDLSQNRYIRKIGADPFAPEVSGKYLFEHLRRKTEAVKVALLDQSVICGIGNIYASEALYDARILPTREACSLSPAECQKLVESIRNVLQKAIKAGGSTLKDYRRPDGGMGYFQNEHCVYNQTGKPCPHCTCDLNKTGGIRKIVLGGRSTFYCDTLQK